MQMFAARRAWTFAVALSSLCFGAIGLIALLGGDPVGQRVHMVGIGVTALVGAGYAIRYRSRTEFQPSALLVLVYTSMIANASGYIYWGVYSAFLGLVTVSGYAFASGAPKKHVLQATTVSITLHVGIGAAQLLGWMPAHALMVPGPAFSLPAQWAVLILLNLIMIGTILAGLDAQAKMRTILDEHDVALRDLARREAQLAEAHEAVRDARGGDEGRFSGETLGGRFKLGAVIGRGAMGEVYAATDGNSALPCAVKVLASHLLTDDSAVQRFVREARIVASLDSPNIIKLIDVSQRGAATPFIAMERLAGEDLGNLLKRKPEWDASEVAVVMHALASGLATAHAAGVVHRDLKPGNLFAASFDNQTIWKVLDFGVAKASGSEATMTAGHVVGTPGYMAPEQARGEPVDLRADVYSLAVIAYRMLTGRPVVVPGELPAMIHEVVFRMPPAPSKVANVSSQIEAVLLVGLAKSPNQRFDSALAFADAFAAAHAGQLSHDILTRAASLKARTPWGEWVRRPLDRKRTATDER
jgi:serine/threonine-protein kinase